MKTNLQAPIVTDESSINDALRDIYDELNKIINQIKLNEVNLNRLDDSGDEGLIRVTRLAKQDANGRSQYKLQAKTADGWKETIELTDMNKE